MDKTNLDKNLKQRMLELEEKQRNIGEIYLYIYGFCNFRNDPKNLDLYKIIYQHKQNCQSSECIVASLTKKLNIEKLANSLNSRDG